MNARLDDTAEDPSFDPALEPALDPSPVAPTPFPMTTVPDKHFPATGGEIGMAVVLILLALALGAYLVFRPWRE